MDNRWELYDRLIDGIPEDLHVVKCNCGYAWTAVVSSEEGMGLAMTTWETSRPFSTNGAEFLGMPLKRLAGYAKSWNFIEAGLGVAAINAYYNHPKRAGQGGGVHPDSLRVKEAFNLYQKEVEGKKVTVVGHFPLVERRFGPICDLAIIERSPSEGDYPDTACEYLLPERDFTFISGCTLINKTLPRLLQLSAGSKTIMVGPSVVLSPVLYDLGVDGLSGSVVHDIEKSLAVLAQGNVMALFSTLEMVDFVSDRYCHQLFGHSQE